MDLSFTPFQDELRTQARAFLTDNPSPSWTQLAEIGWTGASVEEELGGAGLTFLEEGILFEETGRALLHGPFLSTVGGLLPALPAEDRARVAAGETSWALALGPLVPDLDTVTNIAIVGGDEIRELVEARRETFETVDETRPLGVVAGAEPGRRLASADVLPALRARLLAALALEAIGVGSAALELAVAYAGERTQFGRPIGAYQGVAFPLVDAYASVELARSLAWWAAWCVATDHPDAELAAAAAKAAASDAAVAACECAIQTLGGIGFTWEHPLHRFYKRSLGIRSWEASPARLRGEIADHLIEGGR